MEGTIAEISRCDVEFEVGLDQRGVMPVARYFVFVGSVLSVCSWQPTDICPRPPGARPRST